MTFRFHLRVPRTDEDLRPGSAICGRPHLRGHLEDQKSARLAYVPSGARAGSGTSGLDQEKDPVRKAGRPRCADW